MILFKIKIEKKRNKVAAFDYEENHEIIFFD